MRSDKAGATGNDVEGHGDWIQVGNCVGCNGGVSLTRVLRRSILRFAHELVPCARAGIAACWSEQVRPMWSSATRVWSSLHYSTVTLFARLRGWSTSVPFSTATW